VNFLNEALATEQKDQRCASRAQTRQVWAGVACMGLQGSRPPATTICKQIEVIADRIF